MRNVIGADRGDLLERGAEQLKSIRARIELERGPRRLTERASTANGSVLSRSAATARCGEP